MAERLKARVCKTLGLNIPRQFESDSHLFSGETMTRLTPEIVKNTIVTVICVLTIVMLATALIVGEVNEPEVLQGGDIQHAMETGQF